VLSDRNLFFSKMPPKSAAERMQEYRQRMSVAKKQEVTERNKKQQKNARSK